MRFKCRFQVMALVAVALNLLISCNVLASDSTTVMHQALADITAEELFPLATRIAEPAGEFLVSDVYRQDEKIGLLFVNSAVVNSVCYSGKPIHVLVGVDMAGVIRSARLLEHHEPIVLI